MITFSDEQLAAFSQQEREFLRDWEKRNKAESTDNHHDDEVQSAEDYNKRMREHIVRYFEKEREEQDYTKELESQFI